MSTHFTYFHSFHFIYFLIQDVRGATALYGQASVKNWVILKLNDPADEKDLKEKLEFEKGNLKIQAEIASEDKKMFLYKFITEGIAERFC